LPALDVFRDTGVRANDDIDAVEAARCGLDSTPRLLELVSLSRLVSAAAAAAASVVLATDMERRSLPADALDVVGEDEDEGDRSPPFVLCDLTAIPPVMDVPVAAPAAAAAAAGGDAGVPADEEDHGHRNTSRSGYALSIACIECSLPFPTKTRGQKRPYVYVVFFSPYISQGPHTNTRCTGVCVCVCVWWAVCVRVVGSVVGE